ncbi:MAG TPA: AAA family ATPase [Actinocatenispora sp.]
MTADDRTVVLVNGFSGAGKSTLARRLAGALRLPLFSKDVLKETLADALDEDAWRDDPVAARRLGAAAGELQWSLLADAPAGAVVESVWLGVRHLVAAGLSRAGIDRPLEVWCDVPVGVARQRVLDRGPRHPVHVGEPHGDDRWAEWARAAEPLAFGPVYRVDTTGPVGLTGVLDWVGRQRVSEPRHRVRR